MSAYTPTQMTAIRAELLESHLRITGKNVALIKELKAQIEALELENEAHDEEIACINGFKDAELAWIADPESEPEIQASQEALLGEDYAQAARDAFQAAEASAELNRRELDRETKVCCDKCENLFKRNGREHDEFIYDKDGEYGICADCYDGEYDNESESEEEESEDEEEEGVCNCVEDYEAYQKGAEYQEIERRCEAIKKKMEEKKEKMLLLADGCDPDEVIYGTKM